MPAVDFEGQSMPSGHEFRRPLFQVSRDFPKDSSMLKTLPDLIDFNAEHNPDHLFALQEVRIGGKQLDLVRVNFRDLKSATIGCSLFLRKSLFEAQQHYNGADNEHRTSKKPVALFLESDVTLFIYLAALLYLDIPVLMLSIRLSPVAIAHLLNVCSAQAIIVSKRTQSAAKQALNGTSMEQQEATIQRILSIPYENLLDLSKAESNEVVEPPNPSSNEIGALILHSSGTTGLPKPISLAHRYLLGYAACHRLEPEECNNRVNVSTLPMYHGFGLLAPCLSLSTGKACCFLSGSTIPSASSVVELINRSGAFSLMTVPTILEEMISSENNWKSLIGLDFVAVGGGAIKSSIGEQLVSNGVKLLNHYGATEIGAIAPIFCPGKDYDWHYLRLRTDMGLEVNEVEQKGKNGETLYQLTGFPFAWGKPFPVQDILELRPNSKHTEVKILGRDDDLIVLSTGEKVRPQRLEEALLSTGLVKVAVVFGEHRPEVGVIVEPVQPLAMEDQPSFVEAIWTVIRSENLQLDRHARVPSKTMIVIKPTAKVVPRSDKGSVMRKQTFEVFQDEIEAAYRYSSNGKEEGDINLSSEQGQLERDLKSIIQRCVQDRIADPSSWDVDDDFFSRGMDSLEATRLARILANVQNKTTFPALLNGQVSPQFIYQNPSVRALAKALLENTTSSSPPVNTASLTIQQMKALATQFSSSASSVDPSERKLTVLLTGSTGHLGAYLLQGISQAANVEQIICFNRSRKEYLDKPFSVVTTSTEHELRSLQLEANSRNGITLGESSWRKIRFLPSNHIDKPNLGLPESEYGHLKKTVTHIIHNAWPMDFQRTLLSFTPQIRTVRNLIDFAVDCHFTQRPCSPALNPQLLVLSSIAVCARSKSGPIILEAPITDPSSPAPFGYPQAKWVCENVLIDGMNNFGDKVQHTIVRLGQLTGATESGVWNANEHFPAMLKASQIVGSLPDLTGTYSWIPMDIAAKSVLEILLDSSISRPRNAIYHIENPIRQPWQPLISDLAVKLNLTTKATSANPIIPFEAWLEKVSKTTAAAVNDDTQSKKEDDDLEFLKYLRTFLEMDFRALSGGGVILDTSEARKVSRSLRTCNGVGLDLVDKYIAYWRKCGLLN